MPPLPPPQVFQGLVQVEDDRLLALAGRASPSSAPSIAAAHPGDAAGSAEHYMAGLWVHECERVLADKLVNEADKSWLRKSSLQLAGKVMPPASSRRAACARAGPGSPRLGAC